MSRTLRSRWLALFLLAGALVVSGAWLLGMLPEWDDVANLPTRLATSWVAPDTSQSVAVEDREERALTRLQRRMGRGRIVWSSNRSGNHELYLIDVAERSVRRLTDHPNVDFSSRFSPDGEWIVWARSQREWVSFRETEAWDLWLMRVDGSEARRVVRNGYHPTWGPDGGSIVFQRGVQILELELASGDERVLMDGQEAFPGSRVGDAALHPSGELLTFSVLQHGAVAGPLADERWARLTSAQVCQTRWVPGSRQLLWVDPSGNGGTRIMQSSLDGERQEVLMDLPGPRSHEYFPNLSPDAEWLVWGASAEGHEHDRADYEIYAWRVGSPWEDALRLTFYSGNDQWPDVWRSAE